VVGDERAKRTRQAPGSGKDEGLKYAIHLLGSVTMFPWCARACSLVDDQEFISSFVELHQLDS